MAEMMWCYVYVDGQYVRSELRKGGQPDEFNPRKPALFVQNQRIAGVRLTAARVFYYDAIDTEADAAEEERERKYFSKLQRLPDTHVVLGEVRKGVKKREQKGVDVHMAVDALRVAMSGVVRSVALVTGDADFVPLARAVREAFCYVLVFAFADSLAESLAREADRVHVWHSTPTDWALGTPE